MTPRHHNYFFTRRTMTRLIETAGLELVSLGHPSSVFPLRYLAHKLSLTFDASVLEALARRLARSPAGARAVPVNLWDVMTVVARRPRATT
jgi:hypothetical protein